MQLLSRCQAVVGQSFSCQAGKSCHVVIRQLSGSPLIFILSLIAQPIELKACSVLFVSLF